MNFPDTDNGEMLAEMYEAGMDLTVSHAVDFFLNFNKKKDAEKMRQQVEENDANCKMSLTENETHDGWVLCCTVDIIPTHETITLTEMAFDKIAEKLNGDSDGWGIMQPD
jgi:hypothetical protein